MGQYKIHFSKQAVKTIEKLDKSRQQKIKAAILDLPKGDIIPMKGTSGTYRLRIGGWRILFSYPTPNDILIEKIAPRGGVYKGA